MKTAISFILFFTIFMPFYVQAQEVCFPSSRAADLIALLEASEKDIILIERCNALVKELEEEIEIRDRRIVKLTNDLIRANSEVIEYKRKYENTSEYLKYSMGANGLLILLTILPLL